MAEYQEHPNTARPHQGIAQHTPDRDPDTFHGAAADSTPARSAENLPLIGLINEYLRAA